MQRIKKGDTVEVIAGKDLGERGEVTAVLPKDNRVVVQGINVMKRHQKAKQAGNQQIPAQIVEFDAPLNLSNVMLVCPNCNKKTRVGFKVREDGFKVRVCKKCGKDIE
ncbi:MAG: 50S ribosomal protein L24 [Anaerolineae bacterium]|jgi:large subunit ribosomal protein L24|uniref:50S ribosomal protein L24 n=1 Tax=Candidatus Flexifilum breve TaxID=3140694 RepID=UPI001AD3C9CB|nr:50S ribosomal protein L24 [Chloroflexota bacterium]MBK9748609.1 50S ribosomal protein L24 [Chloroflexota bacterium]MBN8634458.1 50S ribosomal protein L24 [Anaerolineae bacterium]